MFTRLLLTLALVVFSWGCGRPSAPEAKAAPEAKVDDQTFTFDSVKYTLDGKEKISKFKNGSVQIDADSVKKEITVHGSYGPDNPAVTAIEVYLNKDLVVSATPKFKDGKWSATIEANKLETNTMYSVIANGNGGNYTASVKLAIAAQ